jgi:hypothetical protein
MSYKPGVVAPVAWIVKRLKTPSPSSGTPAPTSRTEGTNVPSLSGARSPASKRELPELRLNMLTPATLTEWV